MMRSFFNAVSGLSAFRMWLDVTADNLANVNTIGFKGSRPIFQDVISSVTLGINTVTGTLKSTTYGAGSLVDSTQKIWTVGNFKQTGVNTDLAIQGKGLFILKDTLTGITYYTRDGQFRISREGFMVNANGLKLQGFRIDETGRILGSTLEDIRIQPQLPPRATGQIKFMGPTNMNANAGIPAAAFDPNNPDSYNYRYTITIYDSLGTPYQADLFFRRTGPNTWSFHLRADIDPNTAGYELRGDWTNVRFDPSGRLIYDNGVVRREPSPDGRDFFYYLDPASLTVPASAPSGGTFPPAAEWRIYVGESPQAATVNPNDPIPKPYVTQYASDFMVTADQNGYSKGDILDVYVLAEDAVVVGVYSNGKSMPMYRVALATFFDPEELTKKGSNLYTSINNPTLVLPGGAEKVRSGMLEMSNVDIANEFINLISAQRAYQANVRVITSSNTVLEDTINLIR